MGALFGEFSSPVMMALLCLKPRNLGDAKEARAQTANRVIKALDMQKVNSSIATEPWSEPGAG
jgi:hypothetical protein